MKKVILSMMACAVISGHAQLSNNLPDSGPVSIGTAVPDGGKQLTVNGSSAFHGTIELSHDMFIDGQTVMKSIVRMDSLANWVGLPEDLNILIVGPYGHVTKTTRSGLMEVLMEPIGLDYCGEGDVENPQWFNGLNKLFSPCDLVNVGIGTDAPTVKLDVRGTAFANKVIVGNLLGSADATLSVYTPNHSQELFRLAKKVGGLSEEVRLLVNNDGSMELTNVGSSPSITINNGSGHAIVINDNAGNKIVQLENNGLLRGRKIRLDEAIWADYVFAKDYNLMSLDQIKLHIKEKGHLPGVPAGIEVENNGLDVADMMRIQMEKIEELTLHLITLNERIKVLETENEQLKKNK